MKMLKIIWQDVKEIYNRIDKHLMTLFRISFVIYGWYGLIFVLLYPQYYIFYLLSVFIYIVTEYFYYKSTKEQRE